MIGSKNRFHGHASVRRVYGRGESARAGSFSLKFVLNQHRKTYRVAVAVSKQVNKSAVVRNRIRRRVYETIRALLPPDTGPYDLVFTVFDDKVASMPGSELQRAIKACLKQVRQIDMSEPKPKLSGQATGKNGKLDLPKDRSFPE